MMKNAFLRILATAAIVFGFVTTDNGTILGEESTNCAVVTSRYYCGNVISGNPMLPPSLGNLLEIIIHRDPRMPTVVASLVFNSGSIEAPAHKSGIAELVASNLISKDMRRKFMKAGIDCSVKCEEAFTEIRAHMHPKRLKKFFEICRDVAKSISVDSKNLEIQKKRMLIANDEENANKVNALHDNIRSLYMPQTIFNEESLKSISVDDIKCFFEKNYKNNVVLFNLCGDVDWVPTQDQKKNLLERYHDMADQSADARKDRVTSSEVSSSLLSFGGRCYRQRIFPEVSAEVLEAPSIQISNKHVGDSLRYLYFVNDQRDKQLLFVLIDLLNYEMLRYFRRAYSAVNEASAYTAFSREDEVLSVVLYPKVDVSLRELDRIYNIFIKKLTKLAPKKEILQRIYQRRKISFDVLLGDLSEINSYIASAYISGTFNDRFFPHNAIESANPEDIRKLAEKVLLHQMISKVVTRYRSDK